VERTLPPTSGALLLTRPVCLVSVVTPAADVVGDGSGGDLVLRNDAKRRGAALYDQANQAFELVTLGRGHARPFPTRRGFFPLTGS
jgi:hypothetical protein